MKGLQENVDILAREISRMSPTLKKAMEAIINHYEICETAPNRKPPVDQIIDMFREMNKLGWTFESTEICNRLRPVTPADSEWNEYVNFQEKPDGTFLIIIKVRI